MLNLPLEYETLENGLKVVISRTPSVHRVSLMLNIWSGSAIEAHRGTAHMLEHLMFRGTKRYPSLSAISEAFELCGADFNASTGRAVTSFDVNMPSESLGQVLDLLGDVMKHPKLTDIGAERDIIREEISSDYDTDGTLISVEDLLGGLFYGEAGHPIAGNPDDLKKITVKAVRDFYASHYTADNMTLVIAGNVGETASLMGQIRGALGDLPTSTGSKARVQALDAAMQPQLFVKKFDAAMQSEVTFGFRFEGPGGEDFEALEMLVRLLDDGMASRLSKRLVEELALVYDVEAYLSTLLDTTLLQIHASCRHRRVLKLIDAVYQIFAEIAENGVSERELERVRKRLIWEHEELCDSISRRVQWISAMEESKISYDIAERCRKLTAVTSEQVRSLAKKTLQNQNHAIVIVGNLGDKMIADVTGVMEGRCHKKVNVQVEKNSGE